MINELLQELPQNHLAKLAVAKFAKACSLIQEQVLKKLDFAQLDITISAAILKNL